MEEIVSLPPMEFFNYDFQLVLDFIESLGNPKYKIAGNVDLSGNKDIKTLGNLVEVKGYLDIINTNITSLPENLKIRGYLDIRHTQITSLPDNLHVGSLLSISNSKIKKFPNNLWVGDDLFSHGTPISKKDDIRNMIEDKGGYVGGDIYK